MLDKIKNFSEMIRNGEWLGATGQPLKDVVAIGIGGSFLGPAFVHTALETDPDAQACTCTLHACMRFASACPTSAPRTREPRGSRVGAAQDCARIATPPGSSDAACPRRVLPFLCMQCPHCASVLPHRSRPAAARCLSWRTWTLRMSRAPSRARTQRRRWSSWCAPAVRHLRCNIGIQ